MRDIEVLEKLKNKNNEVYLSKFEAGILRDGIRLIGDNELFVEDFLKFNESKNYPVFVYFKYKKDVDTQFMYNSINEIVEDLKDFSFLNRNKYDLNEFAEEFYNSDYEKKCREIFSDESTILEAYIATIYESKFIYTYYISEYLSLNKIKRLKSFAMSKLKK